MVRLSSGLGLSILLPCIAASLVQGPPSLFDIPLPLPLTGSSPPPHSSSFRLVDNIVGRDFYDHFNWETFDDPTHGRVDYVDQRTARDRNLTSATSNSFIMRTDDTNVVPQNARGRMSNRISSRATYTDSVLVLDVKHVPWGCGTWPAFWTTVTNGWPNGGEIDIIEGVNTERSNRASLHTAEGCRMKENREQKGKTVSTDCVAHDNGNEGCGTTFKSGSYGPDFNNMGGGWYVMKRTQSEGVYVWFFGRNDPYVPAEIRDGSDVVVPDHSWGTPDARFPSTDECNFASHFREHAIIFDTTLCGDWAGNTFTQVCGQGTCQNFVDNNPSAFQDAYWEINSLRIYVPS